MITILCSGSRGDFQPYIALALELKNLGKKEAGVPSMIIECTHVVILLFNCNPFEHEYPLALY
jgi:hypothetical protein